MRNVNPDDPADIRALLREIGAKAERAEPLDGQEAQTFYGYAVGLELRLYALEMDLHLLQLRLTQQSQHGPDDNAAGSNIIFEE